MSEKAFLAKVFGDVQGVGFRYYTRDEARRLNIKGYVKNVFDGSVEVFAEGDEDNLQKLLDWLHIGPPSASVFKVECKWFEPTNKYATFNVAF